MEVVPGRISLLPQQVQERFNDAPEIAGRVAVGNQEDCDSRIVFNGVDAVGGAGVMLTGMIAQRLEQRFTDAAISHDFEKAYPAGVAYIKSAFWDSNGADCAAEAV